MIDEGCYGTEDYKYYLMVLKEISKRKGIWYAKDVKKLSKRKWGYL
jgi:hypothetical protein